MNVKIQTSGENIRQTVIPFDSLAQNEQNDD